MRDINPRKNNFSDQIYGQRTLCFQMAIFRVAILGKKKPGCFSTSGSQKKAGIVLLSHTVTRALPSPLTDFTSEFEMGSGVAPSLKTPAKFKFQKLKQTLVFTQVILSRSRNPIFIKKPHDLLVQLSSTHCCAYTCCLSTS